MSRSWGLPVYPNDAGHQHPTKEQHMRAFKLISVLAAVLALTAIAATTASAALSVGFLPGKDKTPFTDSSGKATLTAGSLAIACAKSKSTGEIVNPKALDPATEALIIIDFEGCSSAGLALSSVGDAAKIILVHIEAKSCIIKETPTLVGGILLKPLPLTLEVPSIGTKIEVTGDVIARLLPENTKAELFSLDLNAPGGVQEFKECKDESGGTTLVEELKASTNGGTPIAATQEIKEGLFQFTKANAQTWDT
jgi:hypothetical protein